MKTTTNAALAAAYRVDPGRWSDGFGALLDRIAPRFARYEPLRRAGSLMLGLLSGLDCKNCWTIAEHRGDGTPDGLQHLLSRAKWDADAVRDDRRSYVSEHFADPAGILVVDETGDVKRVWTLSARSGSTPRVRTSGGTVRADLLAAGLPRRSWQRLSAGAGTKGHRYYRWAWFKIDGSSQTRV